VTLRFNADKVIFRRDAARNMHKATVTAVTIETIDDMHDLKDNHPEFHEGGMSLLTYPSTVQAFFNHDIPRFLGGVRVEVGQTVYKDDAGNFGLLLTND